MHPLLARYLDFETTLAAADRIDQKAPLTDDERALASVLHRSPEQRQALQEARDHVHLNERVQQALVYLAANAAVERLREDPSATAALTQADVSLRTQGATDAQVGSILATVLVEEGFGYDDDPDHFDLPFVVETLEGLSALAVLDADRVEQVRERLKTAVAEKELPFAERAFDAVIEAAWAEGPEPINPEHVLEARAHLDGPAADRLVSALRHLNQEGLIGPRRLTRLLERLEHADAPATA